MDLPIVIPLDPPLDYGKEQLTELRIERKPLPRDLFGVNLSRDLFLTENLLMVASRLTGIPTGILSVMDLRAFDQLTAVLHGFYTPGQTTGPTG